ncbi:MAG: ribonuclease P protein component [Chloroflexi bacterium]|nr:ribonuclease P protein component [Chloroflexota bacterium]
MQRKFRLTRSEDFKRVRRFGKSYAHPLVVLIAQTNDEAQLRVGVAAGRTVGTAVKRNRAKRLMREAMRSLIPNIAPGWDLILIARPALLSSTLTEIRETLLTLLRRAELVSPTDAT